MFKNLILIALISFNINSLTLESDKGVCLKAYKGLAVQMMDVVISYDENKSMDNELMMGLVAKLMDVLSECHNFDRNQLESCVGQFPEIGQTFFMLMISYKENDLYNTAIGAINLIKNLYDAKNVCFPQSLISKPFNISKF